MNVYLNGLENNAGKVFISISKSAAGSSLTSWKTTAFYGEPINSLSYATMEAGKSSHRGQSTVT